MGYNLNWNQTVLELKWGQFSPQSLSHTLFIWLHEEPASSFRLGKGTLQKESTLRVPIRKNISINIDWYNDIKGPPLSGLIKQRFKRWPIFSGYCGYTSQRTTTSRNGQEPMKDESYRNSPAECEFPLSETVNPEKITLQNYNYIFV